MFIVKDQEQNNRKSQMGGIPFMVRRPMAIIKSTIWVIPTCPLLNL